MQSSSGDTVNKTAASTNHPRILVFHKISTSLSFGISNYQPRRFFALIEDLSNSGVFFESLKSNCASPDPNRVSLSFDDGYAHLYDLLIELAERFKITPTIFVPTAWIGHSNKWDYSHFLRREQHFGKAQLKSLQRAGIVVGSHGHTHRNLRRLTDIELANELAGSRKILQDILGADVNCLSYPFGAVDERVAACAAAAGYKYGFSMNHVTALGAFGIGRCPVYGFDTARSIRRKLSGGRVGRSQTRFISMLSTGTDMLNRFRKT